MIIWKQGLVFFFFIGLNLYKTFYVTINVLSLTDFLLWFRLPTTSRFVSFEGRALGQIQKKEILSFSTGDVLLKPIFPIVFAAYPRSLYVDTP